MPAGAPASRRFRHPYNLGTTIWSPLASGLLTSKYLDDIPAGSRADTEGYEWLKARLASWRKQGQLEKVRQLTAYASEHFGCTTAQLAIAWCLANENVTTCLLGASRPAQITENVGALGVARRMTAAHLKAIEAIVRTRPRPHGGAHARAIGRNSRL